MRKYSGFWSFVILQTVQGFVTSFEIYQGIGTYEGTKYEVEHVCFVEFVDQILFLFFFHNYYG